MLKRALLWLGSITSVSLFSISVDLFNIPQQIYLFVSGRPGLIVKEWKTSLPLCAFEAPVEFTGNPTLRATLGEWLDGDRRLIETAREDAISMVEGQTESVDLRPVYYLVSFRRDGYEVKFQFARVRSPESQHVGARRDCNSENLRDKHETLKFVSCNLLDSALHSRISRITSINSPDIYWYSYEYKLDPQHLRLDFTYTLCDRKGAN